MHGEEELGGSPSLEMTSAVMWSGQVWLILRCAQDDVMAKVDGMRDLFTQRFTPFWEIEEGIIR
jgi:hypothetical protein